MIAIKLKKDYEDKSIMALIEERNKILIEIKEYEDKYVFGNFNEKILSDPSPQIVYSINNNELIMLTELINDKLKEIDNF